MKKMFVGFLLFSSLGLAACSNNNEASKESTDATSAAAQIQTSMTATPASESESQVAEVSFKDKTLEFPYFTLKIDKTQIGHDNGMDEDGLIIWYTVKNKSDENIVPQDQLQNLSITQQDETSEYNLLSNLGFFDPAEALYPVFGEDGMALEDDDLYNERQEQQDTFNEEFVNKATTDLLPGKEVQVVTSITLKNTDYPVVIKLSDDIAAKENEELVVNLK